MYMLVIILGHISYPSEELKSCSSDRLERGKKEKEKDLIMRHVK